MATHYHQPMAIRIPQLPMHPQDYSPPSTSHSTPTSAQHGCPPPSYIPQVIPPGTSAATVNFCTFSPYMPNEVKHRKRTSRHQFRVLEDTFRIDPKPNLALRKKLATQLQMTPRSVQVWFQNRRSKEKNMIKKEQEARTRDGNSNDTMSDLNNSSDEGSPLSGDPLSDHQSPTSAKPSVSLPIAALVPGSSAASSSSPPSPADTEALASAVSESAAATHAPFYSASPAPDPLLSFRRGSLPILSLPHADLHRAIPSPSPPDFADHVGRRRSVDQSVPRLAAHPYAHVARAANSGHFSTYSRGALATIPSPPPHHDNGAAYLHPSLARRPNLMHRASMPHALHAQYLHSATPPALPRLSVDARAYHRGSVDSAVSGGSPDSALAGLGHANGVPFLSNRTRIIDAYAASTRTVSSPIPGPLPSPTFAFGNASPANGGQDDGQAVVAELSAFAFPPRTEGEDTPSSEAPAMGFDAYSFGVASRFGSIASIAESEASSFYSDASGACYDRHDAFAHAQDEMGLGAPPGFDRDLRKASCTSLYDGFSGLSMGAHAEVTDDFHAHHGLFGASSDMLALAAASVALPSDADPSLSTGTPLSEPPTSPDATSTLSPGSAHSPSGDGAEALSRRPSVDHSAALAMAQQQHHHQAMYAGMAAPAPDYSGLYAAAYAGYNTEWDAGKMHHHAAGEYAEAGSAMVGLESSGAHQQQQHHMEFVSTLPYPT